MGLVWYGLYTGICNNFFLFFFLYLTPLKWHMTITFKINFLIMGNWNKWMNSKHACTCSSISSEICTRPLYLLIRTYTHHLPVRHQTCLSNCLQASCWVQLLTWPQTAEAQPHLMSTIPAMGHLLFQSLKSEVIWTCQKHMRGKMLVEASFSQESITESASYITNLH